MNRDKKPIRKVADFREDGFWIVDKFEKICAGRSENAVLRALMMYFVGNQAFAKTVLDQSDKLQNKGA